MAWVEQSGTRNPHWRVVWREGAARETEKFPTPEQAERYRQLVAANGDRRIQLPLPEADTALVVPTTPVATATGYSFADWARFWIDSYSGPREPTLAKYGSVIERDLIPAFAALDVAAISKQHDSLWARAQQVAGASPKTIRNKHGLLYQILQAAVDFEPVRCAPATRSPLGCPKSSPSSSGFSRARSSNGWRRRCTRTSSPSCASWSAPASATAKPAGLLVGRVRLLDDPPAVDICQSWQKQVDNTWALSPLKTKSSRRSISLSPTQVHDLISLAAPHLEATDFVFRTVNGKPLHHGYFWTGYWTPAVRKAGLEGLRVHDLRHTHVDWLIAANTPLPVIMRRLGHSSITTTIDRYGHLLPELDASAADAMQTALARP